MCSDTYIIRWRSYWFGWRGPGFCMDPNPIKHGFFLHSTGTKRMTTNTASFRSARSHIHTCSSEGVKTRPQGRHCIIYLLSSRRGVTCWYIWLLFLVCRTPCDSTIWSNKLVNSILLLRMVTMTSSHDYINIAYFLEQNTPCLWPRNRGFIKNASRWEKTNK